MKRSFFQWTFTALLLLTCGAFAKTEVTPAKGVNKPQKTKELHGWSWWDHRFQAELNYLDRTDYWGNSTSQLPKGLLGIKYHCNFVKGGDQWDMKGNSMGGTLPVIDGDFGSAGAIRLDPRASGSAVFHELQVSYGITDAVDVYVKIPFLHLKVDLDPMYESRGIAGALFGTTLEQFYRTIEKFGRPRPINHYETNGVEMADMDFGASWQYYRSRYFAGSLTGRIYAPTGKLANPDAMLYTLLGPQLDAGKGGWGVGVSAAFDFRPPKPMQFIILSAQMDFQQRFPFQRTFPHFTKPDYSSIAALGPEALAGIQQFFPDLSEDAGRRYTIYPGSIFGLMTSIAIDIFHAADLIVEYDYIAVMPSIVKGLHAAADQMMSGTLFAGGTTEHHLQIGLGTSALFALSIPVRLSVKYEIMFAGANTLQLVDNWSFGVETFIPAIMPDTESDKRAKGLYTK